MRMYHYKKLPEGAITHFEFGYEQIGFITLKNQLVKVEYKYDGLGYLQVDPDTTKYGPVDAPVFRKKAN